MTSLLRSRLTAPSGTSRRSQRSGWFASLWFALGVVTPCVAQIPAGPLAPIPPRPLEKGEMLLRVELVGEQEWSTGSVASDGGSTAGQSAKDSVRVTGLVYVKPFTPAAGKRVLRCSRVVNGSLNGSLHELRAGVTLAIGGEGGDSVNRKSFTSLSKWDAGGRYLMARMQDIVVDVEHGTWTFPEFPDSFQTWSDELQTEESHLAVWQEYGENDELITRTSSDPRHGYATDRLSQIGAWNHGITASLKTPHPLLAQDRETGKLSGAYALTEKVAGGTRTFSIVWSLLNEAPGLELRVTAPGLFGWLPTATIDRVASGQANGWGPGAPLAVTAEVVDPSGGTPIVRIKRMRWSLEGTTKLPGLCLNWPLNAKDDTFDFDFDHPRATERGQVVEFTDLTTLKKSVRVRPWDFGGWTVLHVTADLDDGRTLHGKLETQTGGDPTAIRLPMRAEDSKVASVWKLSQATGGADDSDPEDTPKGGARGDGFTLFEEYRGFVIGGKHVRGDPQARDVFVYDRVNNAHTRAAIGRFQTASNAAVHVIAAPSDELDDTRVVNPNRGDGPTHGAQHAIGLRSGGGRWRPFTSATRPGEGWVEVTPPLRFQLHAPQLFFRGDLYDRAIAQAMFRACGVLRAGFGDKLLHLTVERGPDGAPVVKASGLGRVTLRDERTGHDLGEDWLATVEKHADVVRQRLRGVAGADAAAEAAAKAVASRKYFIALRGGQHSGPVGNIMRDAFADGYLVKETNTICLLSREIPEKVGYELSETNQGDSYNDKNASPRTRYGDSLMPAPRSRFTSNDHAR